MAATDSLRTRVRAIAAGAQSGFSMLEILISMFIMAIGLLGLIGMQAMAQTSGLESYQRAQALVLLSDIVDRINTNRSFNAARTNSAAECYAITANSANGTPYLGTAAGGSHYNVAGFSCPQLATNPAAQGRAQYDLQEIDNMLQGAAEALAGGQVGAMIGARACIGFDAVNQNYTVAVAWQGVSPTFSPATWANVSPFATNCALGLYGVDTQRRVVWTTLRIALLQ